jgi:hypothetical protein
MFFSFPSTGKERMESTNESMRLDDGDLLVVAADAPPRGAVILLSQATAARLSFESALTMLERVRGAAAGAAA